MFSHCTARKELLLKSNSSFCDTQTLNNTGTCGGSWAHPPAPRRKGTRGPPGGHPEQGHSCAVFPNEDGRAHHVFIRFVLAVDHLLLGAYQPSVLLAQPRACVERAQLHFPGHLRLSQKQRRPPGGALLGEPSWGSAPECLPSAVPPRSARRSSAPMWRKRCACRDGWSWRFPEADGWHNGEERAYCPRWERWSASLRRQCLL